MGGGYSGPTCERGKRNGSPCRLPLLLWSDGGIGLPDPRSCSTHLTKEERAARSRYRAELWSMPVWDLGAYRRDTPACWGWPVTDALREIVRLAGLAANDEARTRLWTLALDVFTDGRCATCGTPDSDEIDDHDHETGLRRGRLCRPCNAREGVSGALVFRRYRERNPYSMLGIIDRYEGFGWDDGEPAGGWDAAAAPADRWRDNAMRGVM